MGGSFKHRQRGPVFPKRQQLTEGAFMSGTTDKVKGRVKEAVGALTDDKRLKNEGKADQASGAVKDGVEKVIDKVKSVVSPKK
jgi:uncharacterized protein YjbJ (UPF0337 family)